MANANIFSFGHDMQHDKKKIPLIILIMVVVVDCFMVEFVLFASFVTCTHLLKSSVRKGKKSETTHSMTQPRMSYVR